MGSVVAASSARVLLGLLSLLLWGAAIAMALGGAFVIITYKHYKHFFQDDYLALPGWLAMAAAFLLLPAGGLGLSTPNRSARWRQGTFMYATVVLICLEASSAILAQAYSLKRGLELKAMDQLFHWYIRNSSNPHSSPVDELQEQLECCGLHNYTDWVIDLSPSQASHLWLPESCCKKSSANCTGDPARPDLLYQEGCRTKLEQRLEFTLSFVFWCCMVVGCLQLLAAIANGILMKQQPLPDYHILESAKFS
ncbi:tetraspanin-3-like isoform X1 [Ornithorhynchus anatinus]|uniref:tetraspanin-3-like isoform X1 n=1 Tax=Ornithorhynchus anatinus TaxID=9258 RepID=UPI0010A9234D|nr:tetraspanin-3-like isoform X1 [Ornithorhynchus anatinus]